MKLITQVDTIWHNCREELPTLSTDVEFMDTNGNTIIGEIVVEMSGHYVYANGKWDSFSNFIKWRFIPDREYPMYSNRAIHVACDAYCKVCGHYHHTVPNHICRQDCEYYEQFKSIISKAYE